MWPCCCGDYLELVSCPTINFVQCSLLRYIQREGGAKFSPFDILQSVSTFEDGSFFFGVGWKLINASGLKRRLVVVSKESPSGIVHVCPCPPDNYFFTIPGSDH